MASARSAGTYRKTAFTRYILDAPQPLSFLRTYVWVLRPYDRIYTLNRPYSFYHQEPYATQLRADPFAEVPSQASQLFAASFRKAVLNNLNIVLTNTLAYNDICEQKPIASLALLHNTTDDDVPFFNSQDAYDAMQKRSATQVKLHPIQGGNCFFIGYGLYTNSIISSW